MPRIRGSVQTIHPLVREELVEELVRVLTGENRQAGPVVFELPIQDTDTVHVIVVWEKWRNFLPENRTSIIREAYERFDERVPEEQRMSPKITLILGVTAEDAMGNNLLPYTLIPPISKDDPCFLTVAKAMREVGAIETKQGPWLAFPTRQMRDEALEKLILLTQDDIPELSWGLAHHEDVIEE